MQNLIRDRFMTFCRIYLTFCYLCITFRLSSAETVFRSDSRHPWLALAAGALKEKDMSDIRFFIVLVAVLAAAAVGLFVFEKKTKTEGADERQILEMLRSYTMGFFLLICFNLISFLGIYYLKPSFHTEILFPVAIALAVTCAFEREIIKGNFTAGKFMSAKNAVIIFTVAVAAIDFRFITAYRKTHGIENLIMASTFTLCYFICIITAVIRKFTAKPDSEE